MKDLTPEDLRRAAVVAYFSSGHRGREPLSQGAIAALKLPGLHNQTAVSRAYRLAEAMKYLEKPRLVEALFDEDQQAAVEHYARMDDLRGRLEYAAEREGWPRMPVLHGIPVSVDLSTPADDERQRLVAAFYREAAALVAPLLRGCSRIGVSWGHTVSNLIAALDSIFPDRTTKEPVRTIVPLVGEPPSGETSEFSSTLLAERLLRALPHDRAKSKSLTLRYVHAFLSDRLARHHDPDVARGREAARDYYRVVSSYETIFGLRDGKQAPLVASLDAVITSLSRDGAPWGITTPETEGTSKRSLPRTDYMTPDEREVLEEVAKVAIGDICGVLLPRSLRKTGGPVSVAWPIEDQQARWTGIRREQLQHLAKTAEPGVIVIAFGESKVKTTLAAVRAGLVNHLVIGERLARAIASELAPAPSRVSSSPRSRRDHRHSA